jgi:hypothetical protein
MYVLDGRPTPVAYAVSALASSLGVVAPSPNGVTSPAAPLAFDFFFFFFDEGPGGRVRISAPVSVILQLAGPGVAPTIWSLQIERTSSRQG